MPRTKRSARAYARGHRAGWGADRISASTSSLTIQNVETDELQTVLLGVNSASAGRDMKLVFDTIDGKKYLTKVGTADKMYALLRNKVDRKASKSDDAKKTSDGGVISGGADIF